MFAKQGIHPNVSQVISENFRPESFRPLTVPEPTNQIQTLPISEQVIIESEFGQIILESEDGLMPFCVPITENLAWVINEDLDGYFLAEASRIQQSLAQSGYTKGATGKLQRAEKKSKTGGMWAGIKKFFSNMWGRAVNKLGIPKGQAQEWMQDHGKDPQGTLAKVKQHWIDQGVDAETATRRSQDFADTALRQKHSMKNASGAIRSHQAGESSDQQRDLLGTLQKHVQNAKEAGEKAKSAGQSPEQIDQAVSASHDQAADALSKSHPGMAQPASQAQPTVGGDEESLTQAREGGRPSQRSGAPAPELAAPEPAAAPASQAAYVGAPPASGAPSEPRAGVQVVPPPGGEAPPPAEVTPAGGEAPPPSQPPTPETDEDPLALQGGPENGGNGDLPPQRMSPSQRGAAAPAEPAPAQYAPATPVEPKQGMPLRASVRGQGGQEQIVQPSRHSKQVAQWQQQAAGAELDASGQPLPVEGAKDPEKQKVAVQAHRILRKMRATARKREAAGAQSGSEEELAKAARLRKLYGAGERQARAQGVKPAPGLSALKKQTLNVAHYEIYDAALINESGEQRMRLRGYDIVRLTGMLGEGLLPFNGIRVHVGGKKITFSNN